MTPISHIRGSAARLHDTYFTYCPFFGGHYCLGGMGARVGSIYLDVHFVVYFNTPFFPYFHQTWFARNAYLSDNNKPDIRGLCGATAFYRCPHTVYISDVPARLGLKATALAWLSTARAFKIHRPGQSRQTRLALAWLWPEPRPVVVKYAVKWMYSAHRSARPYSVNWTYTNRDNWWNIYLRDFCHSLAIFMRYGHGWHPSRIGELCLGFYVISSMSANM